MTKKTHSGGRSEWSWVVPEIAAKTTSRVMCSVNVTSCDAPTLAAESAAEMPRRRRYRMLSATPPTAAGVTRMTKEPATWTRQVRARLSRSSTKPDSDHAAPR